MLTHSIPSKIKSLLDLIRFDKPIGFLLLVWPCWFSLASLPINPLDNLKWYFFFLVGSFLMRSAGCIVNDLVDIKIDKKIERTSQRPLVIKSVTIFEAADVASIIIAGVSSLMLVNKCTSQFFIIL